MFLHFYVTRYLQMLCGMAVFNTTLTCSTKAVKVYLKYRNAAFVQTDQFNGYILEINSVWHNGNSSRRI